MSQHFLIKSCFIYFAPAKRLKNKVRRTSNWSEILSQINREIQKASEIFITIELSSPGNMFTVGKDLLRVFCKLFYLLYFKWPVKERWVAKILQTSVWAKNKNQSFRTLVVWKRKIFLSFVYSESSSSSKVCRIQ